MNEPLEVKFLGNDVIEVDGVRMTLELIRQSMNPSELAQRVLLSVKRVDNQLVFTSYYTAEEAKKFYDKTTNGEQGSY